MVLYASYLTRSGVLGETSVHAFADDGRSFLLILFMFVFITLAVWMLIRRKKEIPTSSLPNLFTREFLMMYGAIVLLLAAFQVISTTSVSVINKIFGTGMTPPTDVIGFYNAWQMPFAILVTLLLGFGQYMVYGNNDLKVFLRKIMVPVIVSLIVAIAGFIIDQNLTFMNGIFLFCIVFALSSSVGYLFRFVAGKANTGAAITHIGFGIFLLGVLITFANKETLSKVGVSGMQGGGDNIMLFKGQVTQMGDYLVCYSDSKTVRDETFFQIDFLKKGDDGQLYLQYSVFPSIKYNSRMGNVYNPDTRNSLKGDVFMYLTFAQDKSKLSPDGYALTGTVEVALGDTMNAGHGRVLLDSLYVTSLNQTADEVTITARVKPIDPINKDQSYLLNYRLKGGFAESDFAELADLGVRLRFEDVSEQPKTIQVGVYEKQGEFIALKIMFFPWIMILWAGAIIMFSGVTVSIWRRAVKAKQAAV